MATGLMAQTPLQLQMQDPGFGKVVHERPLPMVEYPAVYLEANPFVANAGRDTEEWIGLTRYDLQSNYSMGQRIYLFPDNTLSATFTYGMFDPGFSDRGTGYNYHNGSSWGPFPTQRIESMRTGWPSIAPYGANGEVVVSHMAAASEWYLIVAKRENKGTGAWTENILYGPDGAAGMLWPRMVTAGENNDVIHVIALTTPTGNGGTVYEGMDGAIVYSRSTDGGETWDIENVVLPGMGGDEYPGFSADTYGWAAPVGDVLAFSVSVGRTDGFIMKSTDGGDTWEKMLFYESLDNFMDGSVEYGTIGGTDGFHACVIDDNGMVHVAVGRQVHNVPGDGSFYYFPYSNGLLYWNETMPAMDTTIIGSEILDPSGVAEGYLLAELFDDGVNELLELETPNYFASLSSMPQLVFDHDLKILYCFYSAITLGYDNGMMNYRHIWLRWSDDYGQTWSPYTDLNDNFLNMFNENVYPSASPTINEYVHIIYQTDNSPGGAVRGENHPYNDNNITYLTVGKKVGLNEAVANVVGLEQVYPNPAQGMVNVVVNVDRPVKADVSLVNMLGQEVVTTTTYLGYAGAHQLRFDVSDLKTGIYFVRVKAGNSSVARKLVVK